jgi:23S rRNA pseudouridine955/2504/2580 synthase
MPETEAGLSTRLDRWIRRQYPTATQGYIEKNLRLGHILVNEKKAKSSTRVTETDVVTIHKHFEDVLHTHQEADRLKKPYVATKEDLEFLESLIIWEDENLCVINKPYGIAAQGGTKTERHLDGLLQAYGRGKSYKLVHRLDRDTTGVFVVAKTQKMATHLADCFKRNSIRKIYWAIVEGVPAPASGTITAPISKGLESQKEKMVVDRKEGKSAQTDYRILKSIKNKTLTWLELAPKTGRTHQLRVHCTFMGHPILGDGKYDSQFSKLNLHLHARSITLFDLDGSPLTFTAPPPHHIIMTLKDQKVDWESYT